MSHCDRILDALRDGRWRTTASLYREVGPCILHSRISDLRHKGHNVEGRSVPGKTGAEGYEYRLVGHYTSDAARGTETSQLGTAPALAAQVRQPVDFPPEIPAAEQLTVWDAV